MTSEISLLFKPHDATKYTLKDGVENLSVPSNSTTVNLDELLNTVLLEKDELEGTEDNNESFTYIIGNQLFNEETVGKHVLSHSLNTEKSIEVIFFVKVDQPKDLGVL